MTFSQRYGYAPVRTELQTDGIDGETRNRIWNYLRGFFKDCGGESGMFLDIWTDLLGQIAENRPNYDYYQKLVLNDPWYKVFDFLEYLVNPINQKRWIEKLTPYNPAYPSRFSHRKLPSCAELNNIFQRMQVGWMLVNYRFLKTTDNLEIQTIEAATRKSDVVGEHISNALRLLTDRKSPDYKNSFKESISAVEAQCNLLAGSGKAILPTALSVLAKKGTIIHPALIEALKKLYSYSSDSVGVRHGNIGESDVDGEMAKFMLVICSSFVNYLRSKTPKA